MQIVLLTIRLVLCGVFAAAGLAKLADRARCRSMLVAFGVPVRLANPLAVVLPVVELMIAASLLPLASAWFAATLALLLLFLFIGEIVFNISRGRTPQCNCFGQIHSAPIGWSTVVRNAALAALAGFIVWRGKQNAGPSIVGWIHDLTAAQRVTVLFELAAIVLLATGTALLVQLLRQQGRVLLRMEGVEARLADGVAGADPSAASRTATGLQIGGRAPGFRLDALDGYSVTLELLLSAGRAVVLLFTNPHCGPCSALIPEAGAWQQQHRASLTIALVSEGTPEENRAKSVIHEPGRLLLQQKREVAEKYHAWATPAAVLVSADGTIGSYVAQGADAIRTLVTQAAVRTRRIPAESQEHGSQNGRPANGRHTVPPRATVTIGDPAPALDLLDLNGKRVGLKDFQLGNVLVLFWNPACGFCQQMLNDLKEWERDPPTGAPTLVLVSTGTIEDNRAMQLRSRVMIDDKLSAGSAFGANGTPMGVLVDAKGRIASDVVAGARAVMALANA